MPVRRATGHQLSKQGVCEPRLVLVEGPAAPGDEDAGTPIASADSSDLGGGYTLLLAVGCLHGLPDGALEHAAAAITGAAKPGATLLMLAFAPGHRGPMPGGIDPARIPELFPQGELRFSRPAAEITLTGPLRNVRPAWYQLVKH